jgi:hypothetical protein
MTEPDLVQQGIKRAMQREAVNRNQSRKRTFLTRAILVVTGPGGSYVRGNFYLRTSSRQLRDIRLAQSF